MLLARLIFILVLLAATGAIAQVVDYCQPGGLIGTVSDTGGANAVGPFTFTPGVTDYSITYKNTGAGSGTVRVEQCCTDNCDMTSGNWLADTNFGSGDAVGAGVVVQKERTGDQAVPACLQRVLAPSTCTTCNIEVWLRCLSVVP